MPAAEPTGKGEQSLVTRLDCLVHRPGFPDRHILVVGGDDQHRGYAQVLDSRAGIERNAAHQLRRVGLTGQGHDGGQRWLQLAARNERRSAAHGGAHDRDSGDAPAA